MGKVCGRFDVFLYLLVGVLVGRGYVLHVVVGSKSCKQRFPYFRAGLRARVPVRYNAVSVDYYRGREARDGEFGYQPFVASHYEGEALLCGVVLNHRCRVLGGVGESDDRNSVREGFVSFVQRGELHVAGSAGRKEEVEHNRFVLSDKFCQQVFFVLYVGDRKFVGDVA